MSHYDAIVVGGGPAGASAAGSLARGGARVLLLEEKRMPREKLCGEFITPEAFCTLERLGVMERMLDSGARKLTRLSLCVSSGKTIHTPVAAMSGGGTWAMSLSRARFDRILFERAQELGASCVEGMAVRQCIFEVGRPAGVEALSLASGKCEVFKAPVIVDASGRNSRLMLARAERVAGHRGTRLYAMKAHLDGVEGIGEQVELYFFPEGYGGMSCVEDGLVNLCFITSEQTVRRAGGDAAKVLDQTVKKNPLARERLMRSRIVGRWLTAGPLSFGKRRLCRDGIIAVGDAAGMIDPFTGTGLQIALRSGELAAESILGSLGSIGEPVGAAERCRGVNEGGGLLRADRVSDIGQAAVESYTARYRAEFGGRMAVAGVLRRAAFWPAAANLLAGLFVMAPPVARAVLKATRSGAPHGSP